MSEPPTSAVRWVNPLSLCVEKPYDTAVAVVPVSEHDALRDAARLVVDAEYRREQWGSDTVATFDRAIQALREKLK